MDQNRRAGRIPFVIDGELPATDCQLTLRHGDTLPTRSKRWQSPVRFSMALVLTNPHSRTPAARTFSGARPGRATIDGMEGSGFGGLFGDPDDLQRKLGEFAEQMQGAQKLAWADNAIKLAVDLTMAAINRVNIQGTTEQQTEQLRSVMAVVFPEAVTLVREAREGLQ